MKPIKHNYLGKKYLVENCQKIKIDTVVRKAKKDLVTVLIKGEIEINGFNINITSHTLHHKGKRLWFECPLCKQRCGVIYQHPTKNNLMGCRKCLDLDYRSRRYKGMVENNILN